MNLEDLNRLMLRRFGDYVEPPTYCGTHHIAGILRNISGHWNEFTEGEKNSIRAQLVVNESHDPPLISLL